MVLVWFWFYATSFSSLLRFVCLPVGCFHEYFCVDIVPLADVVIPQAPTVERPSGVAHQTPAKTDFGYLSDFSSDEPEEEVPPGLEDSSPLEPRHGGPPSGPPPGVLPPLEPPPGGPPSGPPPLEPPPKRRRC